jgi:hypothetical protein
MLRGAVAYRSNLKYDCDWRRWETFVRRCWRDCSNEDLYLQHLNKRAQVSMLIGYGHYCLTEHRADNPLAASTIAGSFSGIRHSFRSNLLETDFFDHGSMRDGRKRSGHRTVSQPYRTNHVRHRNTIGFLLPPKSI